MSFHVPEHARIIGGPLASDQTYGNNGAFALPSPEPGWALIIIASDGMAWEHVSARAVDKNGRRSRVPTWKEMCFLKDTYWDGEDVVMQLHPAASTYVNTHKHVLHLWRPTDQTIPLPPVECV
jgi:hypothetical protein